MGYGLLIDTEWCSGCHSCEMACQMEHALPVGQTGILLNQIGPREFGDGLWQLSYLPAITAQCDGCGKRVAAGKQPTCVQHCQAIAVMGYGFLSMMASSTSDGEHSI